MSKIRAFTMPKWGIEMQEGRLAEWMINEGDSFEQGDLIALIETDKISNEVEAEFDSVLRLVTCEVGETYAVGTLLGVFADSNISDDDVKAFADSFVAADTSTAVGAGSGKTAQAPAPAKEQKPAAPFAAAEPAAEPAPPPPSDNLNISPQARAFAIANRVDTTQVTGTGRNGRITYQDVHQASRPDARPVLKGALEAPEAGEGLFASPLAKRIAKQNNIDLSNVAGSGPRGRISKADVLALLKPATQAAAVDVSNVDNTPEIVEMDRIRKVIAKRLTQSKMSVPHFYLRNNIAVDNLLALRKTANLVLGVKASINDYLIKAIAIALTRHRDINIQVHDEHIHYFKHADIGVAMASENGLMSPVLRNVDLLRVDAIAAQTRELLDKCNSGRLAYQDLEGGAITISNLGMMGIDNFDAIITPPQGSILAIGGVRRVLVEDEETGEGYFESQIAISMSCDHRAIDGAAGTKFMATLREIIETPEQLFA